MLDRGKRVEEKWTEVSDLSPKVIRSLVSLGVISTGAVEPLSFPSRNPVVQKNQAVYTGTAGRSSIAVGRAV